MKSNDPHSIENLPINVAPENVNSNLPYTSFGYIPDIAQEAQSAFYLNPHLNPQPYFTQEQYEIANWFTTRVHLAPIGKVPSNE